MRRGVLVVASVVVALVVASSAGRARADVDDDPTLFRSAVTNLQQGRPGEAILDLESLADRGVVDAVVSFDRGLAYADRVRAGGEQPGDLGQAAHGLLEAAGLASDPGLRKDARTALAAVQAEVGRRRARAGEAVDLDPGMPLGPSIVRIMGEDAWALLGVLGSVILGAALFVRRAARERQRQIAASVTAALATAFLFGGTAAAYASHHERITVTRGVVVSPGARPTNDRGMVIPNATTIPEAAEVSLLEHRSGWVRVRWGTLEAWIPAASVRPLSELAR